MEEDIREEIDNYGKKITEKPVVIIGISLILTLLLIAAVQFIGLNLISRIVLSVGIVAGVFYTVFSVMKQKQKYLDQKRRELFILGKEREQREREELESVMKESEDLLNAIELLNRQVRG